MSNAYRSVLKSGGTAPTGDAVVGDVLAGKTFSNANAVGLTGTMVNRGAVTATAPYTIPEGYHNGNGTVSAPQVVPSGTQGTIEISNSNASFGRNPVVLAGQRVGLARTIGTNNVLLYTSKTGGSPAYTINSSTETIIENVNLLWAISSDTNTAYLDVDFK